MSKTIIGIGSFVLGVLIALIVSGLLGSGGGATFGSQIQNDIFWFTSGINIGNTNPAKLTASGNTLLTSGGITISGVETNSGLLVSGNSTTTGTSVVNGLSTVLSSASSSILIGSNGGSSNSGCLELGDSSATGTIVYITAHAATLTATTTKPSVCM